jgi:aminoglycoside phosphotransferase (APT) family kinase protein
MDEIAVQLQGYIEQSYTGEEWPLVSSLSNISSGWESDVYAFRLETGAANDRRRQDLILRIYPGQYADQKAQGEYRTLSLLHGAGYPVPQVFRLETNHAFFGRPFILMEKIEGTSLWPMLFHGPEEQQEKWLALYCGLMLQLHHLDWQPYLPEEARKIGDPLQYARREVERGTSTAQEFGLSEFQPLMAWLGTHLEGAQCARPAVVHWDFHPENILIREDGSPLVIDWTSSEISDARFDLAWALLLVEAYEGEAWRGKVQAEYERQAGAPLVGMDFFNAYACARRLGSVMISMKAGAGALGMRPGAEETMKAQREPLKKVAARLRAVTGLDLVDIDRLMDG